jgi:hypothetical protein
MLEGEANKQGNIILEIRKMHSIVHASTDIALWGIQRILTVLPQLARSAHKNGIKAQSYNMYLVFRRKARVLLPVKFLSSE